MTTPPLLQVERAIKRFPGVLALNRVGLTLQRGEVLAVIGENGAGKSTLMKCLAGVLPLDSGRIRIEGVPTGIHSVQEALALGIALIHQELNLPDNLDIGSNIFLGREPRSCGIIDSKKIYRDSALLLKRLGLDLSPRTIVRSLSIGVQQMVEIAKALSVNARILIMDEPTSSLSEREAQALFKTIRELRGAGVSIIYISHRIGEVRELVDRVLVLRDGENAGQLQGDEISRENMVRLMVGRELSQFYHHERHEPGGPLLEVSHLVVPSHPQYPLTFQVRSGEVVGIAGLVGAGRTELLRTLFGIDQPRSGTVRLGGQRVEVRSPKDALEAGIALVPEDRKAQGLILEMAIEQNLGLPGLRQHQLPGGFINRKYEKKTAAEMMSKLAIRAPSPNQPVQFLSGGNQQKVVLGKWLAMRPKVMLLDEPTRGVDVGAKEEIYRLVDELVRQGVGVLFASSEMEEILGLSDRALVMHEGRLAGELTREELSEESVMHLATGQTPAALPVE